MGLSAKVMLTTAALMLGMTAAVNAWSQSLSGRGVEQRAMAQVGCVSEIERMQEVVQTLKQQKQKHLDCNDQGRIFDGGDTCVDVKPLQAVWDSTSTPSTLHFENVKGKQIGEQVEVIRGDDGAPGACPDGYVKQ